MYINSNLFYIQLQKQKFDMRLSEKLLQVK